MYTVLVVIGSTRRWNCNCWTCTVDCFKTAQCKSQHLQGGHRKQKLPEKVQAQEWQKKRRVKRRQDWVS